MQAVPDYELVDFGDGARLERFGDRIVDRPHPGALGARRAAAPWLAADLRFDRDRGWTGPAAGRGPWAVELAGRSMELRPTDAGQVGVFPEHIEMIPWLQDRLQQPRRSPAILHLFAYTGLITLAMAAGGAAVTHVDSARPTVAWARRNAERSGLGHRPIRWIVDDALTFSQREARRGRRYAGIVLDPPSYGHGPAAQPWRLEDDLDGLLDACATVLEPDGFILLTAHTPGFDREQLAEALGRAVARPVRSVERGELDLSTDDGRRLELGSFARWPPGAS